MALVGGLAQRSPIGGKAPPLATTEEESTDDYATSGIRDSHPHLCHHHLAIGEMLILKKSLSEHDNVTFNTQEDNLL